MARKDRAPNPPRRPVQAPQRRAAAADPATVARQRRLLYLFAGSGVVALLVVIGIIVLASRGGGSDEVTVLREAGCTLQSFPALANKSDHSDVPTLQTKPKWNSSPPTSGPHYGIPAVWGSYDEPVPLVQTTHNLEHGGIVILYGRAVPESEVTKIRDFYSSDPNGLVLAPLPSLGKTVALTAWSAPEATPGGSRNRGRGYLAKCTDFSEKAFSEFRDEHRGKGPERISVESLTPGA